MKKVQVIIVFILIFSIMFGGFYNRSYAEDSGDSNIGNTDNIIDDKEEENTSSQNQPQNTQQEENKNQEQQSTTEETTPEATTYTDTQTTTPATTNKTTTTSKSNNANLKNLGITPNDFSGFKPGTTSYDVTVPNDVSTVNVYATAASSSSTISGTGETSLNVGKNIISVVVTAENGTQKTYTINITREEATESNTTSTSSNKTESEDLIKLEVEGYDISPKFSSNVYEYTVDVDLDVTELNIITECAEGVTTEIVGNTDLVEGENTITILVNNSDTKETTTYQIIVNKKSIEDTVTNNSMKKARNIRYILIGLLVVAVISIIIAIIVISKYNFKARDRYEYDESDIEKFNLDDDEDDDEREMEIFNKVSRDKLKREKH